MQERYLIELRGGGDTYIHLVEKEVFDWVTSSEQPGRKAGDSSWFETEEHVPKVIWDSIMKCPEANDWFPDGLDVTIGSYNNDRALHLGSTFGEDDLFPSFNTTAEMMEWVNKNNIRVVDSFAGYIY